MFKLKISEIISKLFKRENLEEDEEVIRVEGKICRGSHLRVVTQEDIDKYGTKVPSIEFMKLDPDAIPNIFENRNSRYGTIEKKFQFMEDIMEMSRDMDTLNEEIIREKKIKRLREKMIEKDISIAK